MCSGRLGLLLAVLWGCGTIFSMRQAATPVEPCQHENSSGKFKTHPPPSSDSKCLEPLVSLEDRLSLELWIYDKGKFIIKRKANQTAVPSEIVAETMFDLTRIVERKPNGFVSAIFNSDDEKPNSLVPHFKYKRQAIVLRLVADSQLYSLRSPFRGDGLIMEMHRRPSRPTSALFYRPPFYVDDVALRHSSQIELAPPEESHDRSPVSMQIKLSIISPLRHVVHRQMEMGLKMAESILNQDELDEIRYLISDEYMYRFILTQIITFAHIWLDYLAFRNEVGFYVGKKDMGGLSSSSIWTRFICDLIIFLYLMDGGGTSWFILLSVGSGVGLSFWKVCKILKPRWTMAFPFVAWGRDPSELSSLERRTENYDVIARTYLGLLLYPLVIGSAFYARKFYVYSSWYSWLVSNLANAVYTFGFIALCPQLYINYRLKSVAHLPWKVFMYKLFSTFVDDAFAFLIQMPLKHKLMTLRDDVIFVAFLVQAYLYRADKSRPNEFGYAYDGDDNEEGKSGESDVDAIEKKIN